MKDLTIFEKPRKGCHHCHGRGFIGYYSKDSKIMPLQVALCNCLTNRFVIHKQMPDTINRLSQTDFNKIKSYAEDIYNLGEKNDNKTKNVGAVSIQEDDKEKDISVS